MGKKNERSDQDEQHHLEQRRKERARQYLIEVADLSLQILEELRNNPDGLSRDDIAERFPSFSSEHYRDAIESAIEDEYIEQVYRDDDLEWYRAIPMDGFDD